MDTYFTIIIFSELLSPKLCICDTKYTIVKIHLDIIPFRNFGPSISDACPLARCKSMTETQKYQNNNEETHGEEKDGHDR
jgi:hypothetical protein